MTIEVKIRLEGEGDFLRLSWQTAEAVLETVPFERDPVQTRYNLLLALQEALTNILKHGYGGCGERNPVEIRILRKREGLWFELRDKAEPFDPTLVSEIDEPEEGRELPEGGYGIHIIQAVVDELRYHREGGWNVLTLHKALKPVLTRI